MFKSPGFTMVELSITLVILMIMSVIAIPLYHQIMASVESKTLRAYSQFIYKKPNMTQLSDIRTSLYVQVLINWPVIPTGITI